VRRKRKERKKRGKREEEREKEKRKKRDKRKEKREGVFCFWSCGFEGDWGSSFQFQNCHMNSAGLKGCWDIIG